MQCIYFRSFLRIISGIERTFRIQMAIEKYCPAPKGACTLNIFYATNLSKVIIICRVVLCNITMKGKRVKFRLFSCLHPASQTVLGSVETVGVVVRGSL